MSAAVVGSKISRASLAMGEAAPTFALTLEGSGIGFVIGFIYQKVEIYL